MEVLPAELRHGEEGIAPYMSRASVLLGQRDNEPRGGSSIGGIGRGVTLANTLGRPGIVPGQGQRLPLRK